MVLRARSLVRKGWAGEAVISTYHPAAAYGAPVLLVDGNPLDPATALLADYEILDATSAELELLQRGGYRFDLEGV